MGREEILLAIKVVVNYPKTKEGMKELYNSQSKAILSVLSEKLSKEQLDELMTRLEQSN